MDRPPSWGEPAEALGKQLGIRVGEVPPISFGHSRPAVQGAKGEIAKALKAAGGRWDARDKALVFGSWPTLEAVLRGILERQVKGDEQA
ncbi:hypothetical protein ACEN9J_02900 [Variovorax sp. Varisp41]|uniref:hypothetical protein n=1 Tax=Variovorax sp. Varisp41 TaxID=3243033 RepID=UPI0039B3D7DC